MTLKIHFRFQNGSRIGYENVLTQRITGSSSALFRQSLLGTGWRMRKDSCMIVETEAMARLVLRQIQSYC